MDSAHPRDRRSRASVQPGQKSGCGRPHLVWLGALWSLPASLLGLGFAALSLRLPAYQDGLLVAESDEGLARVFLTRRGFAAITLGRVVVSAVPLTQLLRAHEEHHARQYDVLGPFFLPVYLWLHLRDGYGANPLEREAVACATAWARRGEW